MKWLPCQAEVFAKLPSMRKGALVFRRQLGKTTLLSGAALLGMIDVPGSLVTYCSASLLVGRELIEREAQLLHQTFAKLQEDADQQDLALRIVDREATTKTDGPTKGKSLPKIADFTELFEKSRLMLRLWHSNTISSRTQIIAPNPATARGFSGWVLIDEVGWISQFRDMVDAMAPIASRDASFRQLWATTPPADDAHYSYEMLVPPAGTDFPVNPKGNWYTSEAGIRCLRVDAWDAAAGGVQMLDEDSGKPITPDESRRKAYDKEQWDRNFGIKFLTGGSSAVSLLAIAHAQERGKEKCLFVVIDSDEDLETACDWVKTRSGAGRVGVGWDIATTTKKQSNPSALAIGEENGGEVIGRLVVIWKTADPDRAKLIVGRLLEAIEDRKIGGRAVRMAIDATNERLFSADIRKELLGRVITELVIASESVENYHIKRQGDQPMVMKQYLGGRCVEALEDGRLTLPAHRYIREDLRLVKKERGTFDNELSTTGQHGDVFDAIKMMLFALRPGGSFSGESVKTTQHRTQDGTYTIGAHKHRRFALA
jgi:hypothetical protein